MTGKQDPQNVKDIIDALANKNKSFQGVWNRLRNYSWDIGGILLLAFSVMTLIATLFPGLVEDSVLLRWTNIIRLGLGWGSVFVVLSGIVLGIWMLKQQAGEPYTITWVRIFALEAAIFCLIALFTVFGGHSITRAREGLDGGLVGWGLVEALSSVIGLIWTGILAFLGALIGSIIGLGFTDKVRKQIAEIQGHTLVPELDSATLEEMSAEGKHPGESEKKAPEKRKQPQFLLVLSDRVPQEG